MLNSPKSTPISRDKPLTLDLSPRTSPLFMRKSPSPKRLSDNHVMDMNRKTSPGLGLKKFKSPLTKKRDKYYVPSPDQSPTTFYQYDMNTGMSGLRSSFKTATKATIKSIKTYNRGRSIEGITDQSEDDSEKSSNASSRSRPKGLNRQRSFTEATKRGLRRLSSAFKSGNESGDEHEDWYMTPSEVTSASTTSPSAVAGAHPRSATVGMYVTPPTLERGIGGLNEILNAKKSLRKSESNKRW